ncbi:MAG TPA: autotransporter outer membrane beta-barrel domain-containing protein [Beijerinckiaceae bacterium]|nr:autotransporter outer membrane beta-barrel domain-containing protein [Beijerinckiaceae bacterium]
MLSAVGRELLRTSKRRVGRSAVFVAAFVAGAPATASDILFVRAPFSTLQAIDGRIDASRAEQTARREANVPVDYMQQAGGAAVPRTAVAAVPGLAISEPISTPATPATRIWGSGFGYWSRTGTDANGAGFTTRGGGGTVGLDRFVDPSLLVGMALTYSHADTKGLGVRSEADTVSASAYAFWAPYAGWEIEGQAGVNRSEIDSSRILTFGGFALPVSGDVDAVGFTALANAGYRFRMPTSAGQAFFKPFAGLTYTAQDRDDYTEAGAFGPTLFFPSKTFERSTVNVGAAIGIDLDAGNGWTVRPELRAAWSHHLIDPSPPIPALLAGVPITLRDPQPGRDGALVAFELTAVRGNVQLFGGYAGEFRSNLDAHQGHAGIRFTW